MSKRTQIEEGQRFGRWVVRCEGPEKKGRRTISCLCECGKIADIYLSHLTTKKSNGCLSCSLKTHGHSKNPAWASWSSMFVRCTSPLHQAYHLYGGRGISICKEWEKFDRFLADMGPRPRGMSLDRIDTNGNYEPSNCRWATAKEQANNTSWNRTVIYEGKSFNVSQLSEYIGMNYHTLVRRLNKGIDIDAPLRKQKTPHAKRPSKIKPKDERSEGASQEEVPNV